MLGDAVESVLEAVGISKQRVQRWLGSCCCEARKEKLNYLHSWSRQSVIMGLEVARRYINQMLEEP
jgi:hypothetical protein